MAADNHTTIVGNLVENPELRFTNNGIAVANMRVAVTQRIQQDGEWRDGDTSFLKVNVWRGQAEHLADSLSKGDRVMVTGRLRQRSWETPEGDKRSVTEIEADEVGARSSGRQPRWSAPASAATGTELRAGSGRPNAVATSTTHHPSSNALPAPSAQLGALDYWPRAAAEPSPASQVALRRVGEPSCAAGECSMVGGGRGGNRWRAIRAPRRRGARLAGRP